MEFEKKERKTLKASFLFKPTIHARLKKMAQEEEISMASILEQVIQRAWNEGCFGILEEREGA